MATENRNWGYNTRIQGALANLDQRVARGTIARQEPAGAIRRGDMRVVYTND
jgi:hypothetical protein